MRMLHPRAAVQCGLGPLTPAPPPRPRPRPLSPPRCLIAARGCLMPWLSMGGPMLKACWALAGCALECAELLRLSGISSVFGETAETPLGCLRSRASVHACPQPFARAQHNGADGRHRVQMRLFGSKALQNTNFFSIHVYQVSLVSLHPRVQIQVTL
jgi:hypothetical protein